jgi:hypothetical protein
MRVRLPGHLPPRDSRLHVAQRRARIDAQFRCQCAVQPLVGGQRIGRPAAVVQGRHELPAYVLIQRMLGRHLLELRQQLCVLSGRQPGIQQRLPHLFP